jgi:outer membrane protein OmpA-like peptidoglycan-associated protein
MKRFVTAIAISAMAMSGTACATKKMVKQRVGEVNDKVDTLSKSVEENQERTKANEAKIADVDQRAQASSQKAFGRADEAYASADKANAGVDKVNARADAMEAASKKVVYEVVLSEDKSGFKFNQSKIPADMQAQIDQIVQQWKANPNGGYIEIEGHTDNVGDKNYNYKLGLERAEAVKRYLYENEQIPLHKINVISYGEEKPIAPNKTKAGRAQNRRVVIKLLA